MRNRRRALYQPDIRRPGSGTVMSVLTLSCNVLGLPSAVRYWWVNQNQTFRQEQTGGYLWSPKRNANGARNPFYEAMREVSPGDVVFSFADTVIAAIGIAQSYCWESPKPPEFGTTGEYWENVGWKVGVRFTPLVHRVRPKDHMGGLLPVLPPRYAPLQANGNGIQSVYLTELPPPFAEVLAGLIGAEARSTYRFRFGRRAHADQRRPRLVGAPDRSRNRNRHFDSADRPRSDHPRAARPGHLQAARDGDRAAVPDYWSREPGASDREPLQALARLR